MLQAQRWLAFSLFAAIAQGLKVSNETIATKVVNCDARRLFYQELQCTAQTFNAQGCATSYTCPPYTTSSNSCRYRGVNYNIDQTVPDALTPSCRFLCSCQESWLLAGETMLSCAQPRCAGFSGNSGCYMGYTTENTCCPFKEFCPPYEAGTCTVGNKVYHLNEKYEPANSCSTCLCKKNQQGVAVSVCQKKVCGMEIQDSNKIAQNCAPVYYSETCCPDEIVCMDDLQNINVNFGASTQTGTCKFNNFNFPTGTTLTADKSGAQISCTCTIPPFLTCSY